MLRLQMLMSTAQHLGRCRLQETPGATRVFLRVWGHFPRRRLCLPALLLGVYFLELGVDDTVAPATERTRRTSIAGRRLLCRAARAGSGGGTVDRLAEARGGL
jgi:hypothetical protein